MLKEIFREKGEMGHLQMLKDLAKLNCFRLWVHFSAIIFHGGPQTHLTRRHSPLFPLKIAHAHLSESQRNNFNSTVKSYVNLCIKICFIFPSYYVPWSIFWYSNISELLSLYLPIPFWLFCVFTSTTLMWLKTHFLMTRWRFHKRLS